MSKLIWVLMRRLLIAGFLLSQFYVAAQTQHEQVDVQYAPQFNFSNLHYFSLVPNPQFSVPVIYQLNQSLEQIGFQQDQKLIDFFAYLTKQLLANGQELIRLGIYDQQQTLVWQGQMILPPSTHDEDANEQQAVQTLVKFFPPLTQRIN